MWRVCTCVVHLSQAHLFLSGLYVQDLMTGSAVWEYRPAFCVWLTGVRPSCTLSLITFRTHVLNLGRVSTLILTKKGHITYIQMFASLRCFQCVKYSCLPCAFYMQMLFCAQSNIKFAASSHSQSVTQTDVCAFSILPIHPVICVGPGLKTCGNRTGQQLPNSFSLCWTQQAC